MRSGRNWQRGAVAELDEILVGGADGAPKLYQIFRTTDRRIGDDANLIRHFPDVAGRVTSLAVSPDGKRFAATSSVEANLTGSAENNVTAGLVQVYSLEFDHTIPADVKAIESKTVDERNPKEKERLIAFRKQDVKQISAFPLPAEHLTRRVHDGW